LVDRFLERINISSVVDILLTIVDSVAIHFFIIASFGGKTTKIRSLVSFQKTLEKISICG